MWRQALKQKPLLRPSPLQTNSVQSPHLDAPGTPNATEGPGTSEPSTSQQIGSAAPALQTPVGSSTVTPRHKRIKRVRRRPPEYTQDLPPPTRPTRLHPPPRLTRAGPPQHLPTATSAESEPASSATPNCSRPTHPPVPSPLPPPPTALNREVVGRRPVKKRQIRANLSPNPPGAAPPTQAPAQEDPSQNHSAIFPPGFSLVETLQCLRSTSRTIKYVPSGARIPVREELVRLLDICASSNSKDSWAQLLLFPLVVFNIADPNLDPAASATAKVKQNLALWMSGDWLFPRPPLPKPITERKVHLRPPPDPDLRRAKQVEAKIADKDIKGAVRILASSEGVAQFSVKTKEALLSKHPRALESLNPPTPAPSPPLEVSVSEVSLLITKLPAGSSGGPDGLRPQHLKDLGANGWGPKIYTPLTAVVNIILAGKVPQEIRPILFGASLIALEKKCGGIRPIAVGCTLRRIAARLACAAVMEGVGSLLRPHQLGFGTPGGAEIIVHSTRRFISPPEAGVMLKLDFANAFNTVRRQKILNVAHEHTPTLYPLILQAYGSYSHLFFGSEVISSEEGLQQGDPLAPALFCLVINGLVQSLKSPINSWYLDDGTFCGPGGTVMEDLRKVIAAESEIGMTLNPSKCELRVAGGGSERWNEAFSDLLPGLKLLQDSECLLLGAPLTDEAIPIVMDKKVGEISLLTSRLPHLQGHSALFLLKSCLSMPKLVYLLRCSPTWKANSQLEKFDNTLREALEAILNVKLDDTTWAQASLPVPRGGLGVRSARDLSVPAFLASVTGTADLVSEILEAASSVPINASSDSLSPPTLPVDPDAKLASVEWLDRSGGADLPLSFRQRDWEAPLLDKREAQVLQSAKTPQDKARLLAASTKESGAWLSALPIASLGLFMDNDTIRIASGLRLGAPLCHPHTCKCGEEVDHLGTHGLSCKLKGGTFTRHSAINDIIKRSLASVNVPSVLEPTGMLRSDGKRPDGLTTFAWSNGRSLVWDATCVDTLCKSHVPVTSISAGAAASKAEKKKRTTYKDLPEQYRFCPFAVETTGVFGKEASDLVKDLGRRLFSTTGEPRSTSYLIQRIAVAIQRGNAASVIATTPTSAKFHEIYYL